MTRRTGRETGSVLALVPAGFLVLVALGALAVDSAVAYEGQQQLHDTLVAAANDATSSAVDRSLFYSTGHVSLSASGVAQVACQSLASQKSPELHGTRLWFAADGAWLRLTGESTVYAVFGRAIPGFGTRHVRATVNAVASISPTYPARPPQSLSSLIPLSC